MGDYAEIYTYHTDPKKYSSDNDTLSDGTEVLLTHTKPWKDDSDNDTLNDDIEYQNGLNPMSNDTDSDQWLDGVEYHYWLSHGCNSAQAYANCKNPDVDGDGITDYQEVYGYTVKVATSFDQNGNPIMQEKTMYGDPLLAYAQGKDSQGNTIWTDTDGDNIPDIVEVYFSNTTNIDNNATWEHIIRTGFPWLANYQWCREYYWALNGSDSSKAENWTQKAFNPFVVCNLPPMITDFTVEAHEEWGLTWYGYGVTACYLTVSTEIKSVGGFGNIYIGARPLDKDSDTVGWSASPWDSALTQVSYDNIRLDVDWWTLKLTGYCTHLDTCSVADIGGRHPAVSASHEIEGIGRFIANVITNFFAMLTGGLSEKWEQVTRAVESIASAIKNRIHDLLIPVAEALSTATKNYVYGWADALPPKDTDMEKLSIDIQKQISTMFGSFTDAYKKAVNIVYIYVRIGSMKEVVVGFAEIMRECMLTIYGWTGIEQILPQISEAEAMQAWEQLQAQVKDIGSLDAWRKFGLAEANKIIHEKSEGGGMESRTPPEYKYGIIIGEYDASLESAAKHDVDEFYKLLTSNGYTMIEIPGKYHNLQLTKEEINTTFVYLRENLSVHPGAKVFIAFIGHGIKYSNGEAAFGMAKGADYFWYNLSEKFDMTILDQNGDGKITDNERNAPPYSTLIMLFSTCYSEYAIENFSRHDSTPMKRILISATNKDEVLPYWPGFPISFNIFAGHFTNKLQSDSWEEFLMIFTQYIGGMLTVGSILFLIIGLIFSGSIPALIVLLAVICGIFQTSIIMALIGSICMLTGDTTIYSSWAWGSIWAPIGIFFGLAGVSHPKIYNPELAKETIV